MADYYTQEVVTNEQVYLTPEMERVLELRGAEVYREGDETVLDHLANGCEKHLCGIVFEEGWREMEPEELIEMFLDDEEEEELSEETKRLLALDKPDLFHEVLKINPEEEYIELQSGWSCSRMRLDGFGGSSLHVTRKGYLYVTTTNVSIEDGVPVFDGEFVPWEKEAGNAEAT